MLSDIATLLKLRLSLLVIVTAGIGYLFGSHHTESAAGFDLLKFLALIVGTTLTCTGGAALNQLIEIDIDSSMERTKNRPLPRKALSSSTALWFGAGFILVGVVVLYLFTNTTTCLLSAITAGLYLCVYTPLKRRTWLNTMVGAVPGAIPPLGGWVAATGSVSLGGILLFAILFFWQLPHFYALAWMYREDYARGGLQMLPVIDKDGSRTMRQILVFSGLLIPISLLPSLSGFAGDFSLVGSLLLGILFVTSGANFAAAPSYNSARSLFRTSIIYLPCLLTLLVLDLR
jgi:protoheme IX farnesyltransferase